MRLLFLILLAIFVIFNRAAAISAKLSVSVKTEATTTMEILEEDENDYDSHIIKYREEIQNLAAELKDNHEICLTGEERSPIDISIADTIPIYVAGLEFMNYNTTGSIKELDSQFTEALTGFNNWNKPPYIKGGTLQGEYVLWEYHQNLYHAAYTSMNSGGSELLGHSVDGAHYDHEAHFIHVKRGMTMEEAQGVPGAIAIVAVEHKVVKPPSRGPIRSMQDHTELVTPKPKMLFPENPNGTVEQWIQPKQLIPEDTTSFYTYNGSLAHTPCSRGVIWHVMSSPVLFNYTLFAILRSPRTKFNSLVHYMEEPPSVGNRKVFYNYGEQSKPVTKVVYGYPMYVLVLATLLVFGLTVAANFLLRKYKSKIAPVREETKSFLNDNFSVNLVNPELYSL